MAPTRSEAPLTLRESRAALLTRAELIGEPLRAALTGMYDGWLAGLAGSAGLGSDTALVAVGGLGRREPAPYGDVDLVLLHSGGPGPGPGVAAQAQAIWYPIWDSGVGLDHSVRSMSEARAVAEKDARAALGLLDARHIAGAQWLSRSLRATAHQVWRVRAQAHLPELAESARQRRRTAGELAYLLEPDLKESVGGLRDCVVLHALAATQLVDEPVPEVLAARRLLLDVRGELHRRNGRSTDRLVLQDQAPVAATLGLDGPDDLLRSVAAAGRTVRFALDEGWRTVGAELDSRGRWRSRRRMERRPLAEGVVECGGEVMLARSAEPAWDVGLLLRAAAAAATARLPLSPHTLRRLATETPALPLPWPDAVRDSFIRLLASGHSAVPVIEGLDQHGLMARLLPAWAEVRSRPQRNAVHRFTVDRHLVESAAEAAGLTRQVARPDLLLLAALLHDIGKGQPGDHSKSGAVIAAATAERVGLPPGDVDTMARLVRHHLLLPHLATRRDLDDPATVDAVVVAVGGSREVVDLLHALSIADARATGPGAWSEWKAALVGGLVERVRAVLAGTPAPPPVVPTLPEEARLALRMDRPTLTPLSWPGQRPVAGVPRAPSGPAVGQLIVVAQDFPGLLSRVAGLLAVHGLDVLSATVTTEQRKAVNLFVVAPRFGELPDLELLRADFRTVLTGRFPLAERLAAAQRAYACAPAEDAVVLWFDAAARNATVVEVRTGDSIGLLHRLTGALEQCGLGIRDARISTLGGSVVDAFSILDRTGSLVTDPELRRTVEKALLRAAAGPTA